MMARGSGRRTVLWALALAVAAQAPAVGAEEGARIEPSLAHRGMDASGAVLVFVHAGDARIAAAAAWGAGFRVVDSLDRIGVAVAAGALDGIASLRRQEGVRYVEAADTPVSFTLETAHDVTRAREVLDGTTPLGAFDGSGVTIAVVDSGIDAAHPMFQTPAGSKVVRNLRLACLDLGIVALGLSSCPEQVPGDYPWVEMENTDAGGGHGTHVAGIAAGMEVRSAGRRLSGTAPGARLVGLGSGAGPFLYGPAAGLEWVVENHREPCGPDVPRSVCPPIRVVNNSWSSAEPAEHDPDGAIEKLQELLLAEGITVVWAGGNRGGDGTANLTNGFAATPTPGAIMVAAYDDDDTGERNRGIAWFSSRGMLGRPGTYPDVAAPGEAIVSSCGPNLPDCDINNDGDRADPLYATLSGTSMASPYVAGTVALLLQADPTLTPAAIENLLEDAALAIPYGGDYETDPSNPDDPTSYDKGHGLVDVASAVARAVGRRVPAPAPRCRPEGAVALDNRDDARGLGLFSPVPSEPALDLTDARASWGSGALTVSIGVADLAPLTTGEAFEVAFWFRGARLFLEAVRSPAGEERFALGELTTTTRSILVRGLAGSFDPAGDRVAVSLRAADLEGAGLEPIATGEALSEFVVASRRHAGVEDASAGPLADAAPGTCPYTIGLGAVAPPGGLPQPPADGELSRARPVYAWVGGPVTNHNSLGCGGLAFRLGANGRVPSGCDRERIEIAPSRGGAWLDLEIATETPDVPVAQALVTDVDLYLFGPDGSLLDGRGVAGGRERILRRVTEPGVYTVLVLGFGSVEASYEGRARLLT